MAVTHHELFGRFAPKNRALAMERFLKEARRRLFAAYAQRAATARAAAIANQAVVTVAASPKTMRPQSPAPVAMQPGVAAAPALIARAQRNISAPAAAPVTERLDFIRRAA